MTQMVLNISDRSIIPGLKAVLKRVSGVEGMRVVNEPQKRKSKREQFLSEFREAVGKAKNFKEGKTQFATWEEMMDEL